MKSKRKGEDGIEGVERERPGERFFNFFSLLVYFSDLRKSDRRFLSEQKAKLEYATRATHRYQYLSLLSNF